MSSISYLCECSLLLEAQLCPVDCYKCLSSSMFHKSGSVRITHQFNASFLFLFFVNRAIIPIKTKEDNRVKGGQPPYTPMGNYRTAQQNGEHYPVQCRI